MKNFEKLAQILNMFRINSKNKEFTRSEILSELKKLGINQSAGAILIGTPAFKFRSEKFGKKIFMFGDNPIHKDLLKVCYDRVNDQKQTPKDNLSEDKAVNLLISKGYIIKRPVGLDIEKMKRDGIYDKYMLYKTV